MKISPRFYPVPVREMWVWFPEKCGFYFDHTLSTYDYCYKIFERNEKYSVTKVGYHSEFPKKQIKLSAETASPTRCFMFVYQYIEAYNIT